MAFGPKEALPTGNTTNAVFNTSARWFLLLLAGVSAWAIAVCAPFWYTDPNYTYGWIVPPLVAVFLWRRMGTQPESFWEAVSRDVSERFRLNRWLLALPALALFPIEVLRTEYYQSGIVLWAINLGAVGLNLATLWWLGGERLFRLLAFPLAFFLTAVPWPALIATPIQQDLMINVARGVTELLLWMGIPVTLNGAVLTLSKGTVGIVEACSGLRSLQSGLMVSLAVSELFMLSTGKRWILVVSSIALALIDNFIRTLVLCLYVEQGGEARLHQVHDNVGLVAMYGLYVMIWVVGKILARGSNAGDEWPSKHDPAKPKLTSYPRWNALPDARPALAVGIVMLGTVHAWYGVLLWRAKPQTQPYFIAKTDAKAGIGKIEFNEEVWGRLGANAGEQLRYTNSLAPFGFIDAYHLFWKPSPMSKVALHHRPDICMPGSGWKQVGEVTPVEAKFGDRTLSLMLFRFEKGNVKALQLWGVWRNGAPVQMDFNNKLTSLPEKYGFIPSNRHMMGVELVSCFLPYPAGTEPPVQLVQVGLERLFDYRAPVAAPAP